MLTLEKFKASDTYRIRLIHPELDNPVDGWISAPISITTGSMWSNIAEQRFAGGKLDAGMQYLAGRSLTMGAFTLQKWQGPQPVNISLELAYVATRDAFKEVVEPVRELMKFPLTPEWSMAMLRPPVDPDGPCCTIISNWFLIPELVPENTQPQWSHTLSKTGHPVAATVTVSFMSRRAVSMQDVQQWFR